MLSKSSKILIAWIIGMGIAVAFTGLMLAIAPKLHKVPCDRIGMTILVDQALRDE
jgi:hypothetical protein